MKDKKESASQPPKNNDPGPSRTRDKRTSNAKGGQKTRLDKKKQSAPSNQEIDNMNEVFNPEQKQQEKQPSSAASNVKLENSQSSVRSSVASFSLNASSLMSGKSMLMSKRSSGKKTILKQPISFGSDEKVNANPKNINKVRLTRYTLLSWAPLSLFYQFKRAANIYFLIISILTFMEFSPKDPTSMIGTFVFVLFITMIKEAYEDYQRYKNQNEVNQKKAKVFSYHTGKFEFMKWEEIKAGMIIRVEKDQEVPADILVLHSSNITGLVFVDTMNLDGETNLKEKMALCENFDEKDIGKVAGDMIVDTPNELLDYWEGTVACPLIHTKAPMSIKNLLLRGCFIRNTKYTYGIVVYTGMQTKILKNLKKPPHKVSNVMKKMNYMLYTVFVFQVAIILLYAGLNVQWVNDNKDLDEQLNLTQNEEQGLSFFIQMLVYWVAFSHMIPISLYVIIEMLKLGQGILINRDVQMYDKETESFANCRNSDLIEELGQVEIVFSDKTGTLTMNKMIYKKCQIYGERYGDPDPSETLENIEGMTKSGINQVRAKLKEETKKYYKKMRDPSIKDNIYDYPVMNFVRVLSLCHTVVCDIDVLTKDIRYQASSPDELALVSGAKDFGYELVSRNHAKLEIENKLIDVKEIFKVVAEFPFDSTRKCMSVIVKDQYQKYFLLCKGADSVMIEKINFSKSNFKGLEETVKHDLSFYSTEGLRTLVMGMRQVSDEEYETFQSIYQKLVNSTHPYKDKKIVELYQKMESKLRYVGCTAIEDKLQDGVPQTIAMMIRADIRFWMLTGDKLETAIEIAKSCRILLEGDQLLILSTNDFELLSKTLDNEIEIYGLDLEKKITSLKNLQQQKFVIAIDGATLSLVLEDPELEQKFFYVSLVAKSVVCCRVSPKQKADVVSLYKKRGTWVTLSIGDGANDVSMILEANIGVGIKGKEGTQAVRNADYSISQFRFLLKLLLVHGRWGYRRVAKMICYYFYKNIILVFTEIYFAIFNGYSGQIYFLDWLPMLYNAIFTSWPCLIAFNFEEDVNIHYAYKYPVVYKSGQQGRYFDFKIFWKQIFLALWHGIVCFFLPMMSFSSNSWNDDGRVKEIWFISTTAFTLIIHIVTYKLFIESNFWNVFSFVSALVCIISYYGICLMGSSDALASVLQPQLNGMMMSILMSPKFYILHLTVPFICLLPDFTMKHGRGVFFPYPSERIMVEQKKNPKFNFFETTIKSDVGKFLTGVMKKNKSYGQLTSKALSEIDKMSASKRSQDKLSIGSSLKKLGRHDDSKDNTPTVTRRKSRRERDYESESRLKDLNSDASMVEVKAKKKNARMKQLKNAWIEEKEEGTTAVKKHKSKFHKGNESAHQLLDQTDHNVEQQQVEPEDFSQQQDSVSSQMIRKKLTQTLQENKARQGKTATPSSASPTSSSEENEDSLQVNKGQMREQSYKERKKRLMENIKKDMKEKEVQKAKKLQESFHTTESNNQQVLTVLDKLNKQAEVQMAEQRAPKIAKYAVRDHQYSAMQSNATGFTDKYYTSDIPHIIYLGGSSSEAQTQGFTTQLTVQKLQDEGHPLEKATHRFGQSKRRMKKYVEKYRDFIKFNELVALEEKNEHAQFQL